MTSIRTTNRVSGTGPHLRRMGICGCHLASWVLVTTVSAVVAAQQLVVFSPGGSASVVSREGGDLRFAGADEHVVASVEAGATVVDGLPTWSIASWEDGWGRIRGGSTVGGWSWMGAVAASDTVWAGPSALVVYPAGVEDPLAGQLVGDGSPYLLSVSSRVVTTTRYTLHRLDDLSGPVLETDLAGAATLQLVRGPGWRVVPASIASGEDTPSLTTATVVAVYRTLAIRAPVGAQVAMTDLSDGDDGAFLELEPGETWLAAPGVVDVDQHSAALFDDDVVEIRSNRPVQVLSGPLSAQGDRSMAVASSPIGPHVHEALIALSSGVLHVVTSPGADPVVSVVAKPSGAVGLPPSSTSMAAELSVITWSAPDDDERLVVVAADRPFVAFSSPPEGGAFPALLLADATSQRPVARAGADQVVCAGQPVSLDGAGSFDPDEQDDGIVTASWDIDLGADSDGDGDASNDEDASTLLATPVYLGVGTRTARLVVTDADGQTDFDDVRIRAVVATADRCGGDSDMDGIGDDWDNCVELPNPAQHDLDRDAIGDSCDEDDDGDGVADEDDVCPRTADPDQSDSDMDGRGDLCDLDIDGDGVANGSDNCDTTVNPDQEDLDADDIGDLCDEDRDGDGWQNGEDTCPDVSDELQIDSDGDGIGDACDQDDDDDGIPDSVDNCRLVANPDQRDDDNNGVGDVCENDSDGDGIADPDDNCISVWNPSQADTDSDGIGDQCDADVDGDGVLNGLDNCVTVFNPDQIDADANGFGDVCEPDADDDGVLDFEDNCIDLPNPNQADLDMDGRGDMCDEDVDGDGLSDIQEATLGTSPTHADTDRDRLEDGEEVAIGSNPRVRDSDGDGLDDGVEVQFGTSPTNPDSDEDGVADGAEPGWNEDSDGDGAINALDTDSDNGGLSDGDEVDSGLDPLDPTDDEPSPRLALASGGGEGCGCRAVVGLTSSPRRLYVWVWILAVTVVMLRTRPGWRRWFEPQSP